MADSKDPKPKVDFSDTKALAAKRSSRKTKIVVIGVLALVLLLGAVVSVASFFVLRKSTPTRLAEVNLEEGETLTYRVDQNIEVLGGDVRKGTIRAIVGIRVLNKTSEEYWFLMKFNLTNVDGNMDIKNMRTITEYFLVRLQIASRTPNQENKETGESFQIYGRRHTNEEFVRHIYGILDQLLPTLKRDLYEDVDGVKVSDSDGLNPEDSPLLPGSVKMHREANTSYKDAVLIKNHFDRADFLNMSSDVDLDLKYSDFAFINKSNGMVTESHSYFAEQLNFGEHIHFKSGVDASVMKVFLTSHVSLLETSSIYFGFAESEKVYYQFFVKLVVPKATPTFSVNRQPHRPPSPSQSSQMPLNASLPSQQHNSTNSSSIPLKRSRRASNSIRQIWDDADPIYLSVEHSFTVFEKKVIGINVEGKGTVWLEDSSGLEVGVRFNLIVGGKDLGRLLYKTYQKNELQDGKGTRTGKEWSKGITIQIPVLILTVGVDFSLSFQVNNELSFPPEDNSVNPVKLAVEIEPFAEVTASIEAYVSAAIIRAGVYGDGTLVRVGLPVTLSYQAGRSPGKKWCVALSARLTALELNAGIFYQWWNWWWWDWGERNTLLDFGTWAAIKSSWQVLSRCG